MKKIIFLSADGAVRVLHPSPKRYSAVGGDMHQIAARDVPTGYPYKIVEEKDIPDKDEFRDAWTIEPEELIDGVGGPEGVTE